MKKNINIIYWIAFTIVVIIAAFVLSITIANLIYLVYLPQENLEVAAVALKNAPVKVALQRTFHPQTFAETAVRQIFWICMCIFGILIFLTHAKRWFNLQDYKSKVYKVTDDIEIPVPVGDKQTQQGSSWWLPKKDFGKVFNTNTVDPESPTIKKLLRNSDQETAIIKSIDIPYKKINGSDFVDEEKLREILKEKYQKVRRVENQTSQTITLASVDKQTLEANFPQTLVYEDNDMRGTLYLKNYNIKRIESDNILQTTDDESNTEPSIIVPKEEKYEVSANYSGEVLNKKNIVSPEEQKPFKKGGITLGRQERNVLEKAATFPYYKKRKVEDIYFVGDNVHTLTVGATRSGKTRCLVIESIMNCGLAGESMVISDPKGELFEYTSGELKQLGYNVVTLDFKNPMRSSCYNFLQPVIDEIKKGNVAQAQNKASDICESLVGEAKGEKIWNDGEKSTIKTGIMAVCMEAPEEMKNIANVYYFLSNMCKEQPDDQSMLMDYYLNKIKNGDETHQPNPNHPAIASFAPASIAPSKTRSSFFTSALNTLVLFSDQYIASMTSKTEIRAEDLANKKTVLYMILPDEKLTFYSLCSLFVNQIYQQLVNIADEGGGALKNRVNFILDEFGNFSAIPNFGGFLTVGGGRKIRFNLFLQSFSQLNSKYDENTAQNILDNCHIWNYLKTSNDTTAEKISKKLGTYTCTSFSESNSGNVGGTNASKSNSMSLTQRALLTPAEVLRINRPYLLVMYSGQNPAMTIAPDLHVWLFNRLLSLGDPDFCTKVRIIREAAREERTETEIPIWDIDQKLLKEKADGKKREEQAKLEKRRELFSKRADEQDNYGKLSRAKKI